MEKNTIPNSSEKLSLEGQKRASIEKKILSLLFHGFANLTFKSCEYQTISMLNELCELDEYLVLTRGKEQYGYMELTDKSRLCFNALLALDALVERGLVERKVFFTRDISPEEGQVDMEGRLDESPAYHRSWFARALTVSNIKERSFQYPEHEQGPDEQPFTCEFESIQYQLSTKGYDVALTFQEHEDQEKRNAHQISISESATTASVSSAKTASIALYAAFFIAIGSIGNLAFTIYLECWK